MNKKDKKKIIIDPTNVQAQSEEPVDKITNEEISLQKEQAVRRAKEAIRNSSINVDAEEEFKFDRIREDEPETKKYIAQSAPKKKRTGLVIGISIVAGLFLVAVIAYGFVAIHYQSCFMPGTYIDDMDCSEMEVAQVTAQIRQQELEDYSLQIYGKDAAGNSVILGTITAEDVGMELKDDLLQVQAFFDRQEPLLWIQSLGNRQVKHELTKEIVYDETRLDQLISEMNWAENTQNIVPRDAYLSEYSEEIGGYEIIPEIQGNRLDMERVAELIKQALYARESSVNLEEHACYEQPEVTAQSEDLVALRDTLNKWLSTDITYDWNASEVKLNKQQLAEWISVEDGEAVLDEEAVAAFVKENAGKYDTYGKNRRFVTTQGVELTLPSGAFGWKTDTEKECEELIALIKEGTVGDREPVYSSKAPWKGTNDIGNTYVEIDLTNQHLYLYQRGQIVLETDFVSGLMTRSDCITPQGVFRITYKTTNATLRGGDYEQYVNFWMPFHGNFGMHDATWRTEFGGTIYLTDGSHGCINLPLDKAGEIYNQMYEGHPVICYYY